MTSQDNFISMADFIAPANSGKTDYIGMFAVSAGFGQDELCEKYKADDDDYSNILLKTLTDRLAEAFAEELHVEVRRRMWGYSPKEELTPA
jgi:5-methyltetrahydrofolate--homocysteine methyltransferase